MSSPRRRSGPPISPREAAAASTKLFSESNAKSAAARWRRRAWLACGCSETCRCDYRNNPSAKRVEAYAEAAHHLRRHGLAPAPLLPELRQLWRRGPAEREMVEQITAAWAVGA